MNGSGPGIRACRSPRGVRTRGCSFLRPVSPGVSRPIIKQRPDGPLAHYHIHEHGKCIRADTPPESLPAPRARVYGVHRARFECLSGCHATIPVVISPPHPCAAVIAAEKSRPSRRGNAPPRASEADGFIRLVERGARARARHRDVLEIPCASLKRRWRTKGKKRDVDSIARRPARLNFSDPPIRAP